MGTPALTGCATTLGVEGRTGSEQEIRAEDLREACGGKLRQEPPEELTAEEIAYLQMYEERREASYLRTIAALDVINFAAAVLVGFVVAIGVTADE